MTKRFDPAVDALLDSNKHPLREEIDALRTIVLDADESIREGVKWNAASFRNTEWFATLNGPKQVKEAMLILHAGAKTKDKDLKNTITDTNGILKWLGDERAMITFTDLADIRQKRPALTEILRDWLKQL